jgi:hypothetical protein
VVGEFGDAAGPRPAKNNVRMFTTPCDYKKDKYILNKYKKMKNKHHKGTRQA